MENNNVEEKVEIEVIQTPEKTKSGFALFLENNEIAKLSIVLCLITSITALLLGIVNSITAPIILDNKIRATNEAMQLLVTTATDFTELEIPQGSNTLVQEFYEGTANGKTVGYCVKVNPNGYGGKIEIVVGLDADGKVLGTQIISHAETPGLGSKIVDDPTFAEQFIGKFTSLVLTKTTVSAENEISAISGATISSNAMTQGVSVAIEFVENNK